MDPITAFENIAIIIITAISAVGFCLPPLIIGVVVVGMVWWFQTLLLCLQQETGSDKTTYAFIIICLGVLGALIYRLVRTSPEDGSLFSFNPVRNEPTPNYLAAPQEPGPPAPRRPAPRRTGYSAGQVALISVGSSLVGIILCCGSLLAFSAWYEPPLPTRAAPQTTPGPGIFPTGFSFDASNTEAAGIMGTIEAMSTQSAEVMMTSAAVP